MEALRTRGPRRCAAGVGPICTGQRLHDHRTPIASGRQVLALLVLGRHSRHSTHGRIGAGEPGQPVDLSPGRVNQIAVLRDVLNDARAAIAQALEPRVLHGPLELHHGKRLVRLGRALVGQRLPAAQRVELAARHADLAHVVAAVSARVAKRGVVLSTRLDERERVVACDRAGARALERRLGPGGVRHEQEVGRAVRRLRLGARKGRTSNEAAQGGHGYGQTANAPNVDCEALSRAGNPGVG